MTHIVVREYAKLTTQEVTQNSLDLAQIPATAFDWLCRLRGQWGKADTALLHLDDSCTFMINHGGGRFSEIMRATRYAPHPTA